MSVNSTKNVRNIILKGGIIMNYTIERLLEGDTNITQYYQRAKQIWNKILESKDSEDVNKLAELLFEKQLQFESECGGRWMGQEIMAVVGIAQFYSTAVGFEDNLKKAKLVSNAFSRSFCSLEVKYYAKDISKYYNLEEL